MEDSNIIISKNASLSEYTTFQLGGRCKAMVFCATPDDVERAVLYFNHKNENFILIGKGSNLVISDYGLDIYVLRFFNEDVLIERDGDLFNVSAGTALDRLVAYSVQEKLDGLVCLSGIPGTLGGAVAGNAGAFGHQISDYVHSVEVLTVQGEKKEIPASELEFSYRNSRLKKNSEIVLRVKLCLPPCPSSLLISQRREILALRKEKHPDYHEIPCAGSFFRNIEPAEGHGKRESAGALLEQVNAKDLFYGGARVFPKHANIIIKNPLGKAQDVFELSKIMAKRVKEKFQIDLIREVRFVGKFDGMPPSANQSKLFW